MLKDLLLQLGLASLSQPILGGVGTILVFHRIRAVDPALAFSPNYRNSVAPETFERLLDTLAEDGTEIVSLEEAAHRQQASGARRFVCLTFDDGYRDNHDTLLPIIVSRRVPITVYIAPGLIDGSAPLWSYALEQVIAREKLVRLPMPEEAELTAGDRPAKRRAFDDAGRVHADRTTRGLGVDGPGAGRSLWRRFYGAGGAAHDGLGHGAPPRGLPVGGDRRAQRLAFPPCHAG